MCIMKIPFCYFNGNIYIYYRVLLLMNFQTVGWWPNKKSYCLVQKLNPLLVVNEACALLTG
jgi:hypothetical protein